MAKGRKTIDRSALIEKANLYLCQSVNEERAGRKMLQSFVESVLFDHDSYRGFNYLYEKDVPAGHTFGIIFDETEARAHQFPDDSRIRFY